MTTIRERPRAYDKDIMAEVAKEILDDVMKWYDGEPDEREDVLADLTECLADSIDLDGYKLARNIENDLHWEPDSGLVDILGQVEGKAYQIARLKVQEWVKENNIQPAFKVGDRVTLSRKWLAAISVVIVGVWPETAEYIVHEDGKEYPHSRPDRPLGLIVEFENVIA